MWHLWPAHRFSLIKAEPIPCGSPTPSQANPWSGRLLPSWGRWLNGKWTAVIPFRESRKEKADTLIELKSRLPQIQGVQGRSCFAKAGPRALGNAEDGMTMDAIRL